MNRKLIRPELRDRRGVDPRPTLKVLRARKPVPPEQTSAESFYYQKQMTNKTRVVIVLKDGEELRGTIEWYDRSALKVHRSDGPNLLLMKDAVKYIYKESEDREGEDD